MTATFDTLAAARNMEDAGLPHEAAAAVAGAIRNGQGKLATKADLAALEARMQAMLLQAFAIVGAVVELMNLLP